MIQHLKISRLADLNRPQRRQMSGHELAVEQLKSANPHSRNQPRQRHFRCVSSARKHAFAKKGAAHGKPVEAADEFAIVPAFDAVR